MLLPIAVIFLNIVSSYLYKRKGIKLPETNKNAMKYSLLFLLLLAGIFMYAIFIGPLYKPVLYLFAFIYGYLLWRVLKLNAQHLYVYKVERAKAAILVLVILAFVYNL
jgi:Ca2+/Na+ antiporter